RRSPPRPPPPPSPRPSTGRRAHWAGYRLLGGLSTPPHGRGSSHHRRQTLRRLYSPAPVLNLRSITLVARRFDARSYRRFSSAVPGTLGGTCVGTPCSSSATYAT